MRRLIVTTIVIAAALWCARALAQDEDIREYVGGFNTAFTLLITVVWVVAYLAVYSGAVIVTLSYLQVFGGFDAALFGWLATLWAGGIAINFGAYAITPHRPWPVLLAIPLIFGWSLLLGTRAWSNITFAHALRVSIVVALVCAPYAGPWVWPR